MHFLSHKEWPSGAKPDFDNDKTQICVILHVVPANTEYCNQTSKNKPVLIFRSILIGNTSKRMTATKFDTLRAFLFHDCYDGIITSCDGVWPQFGFHSERCLRNRLFAVPDNFFISMPLE